MEMVLKVRYSSKRNKYLASGRIVGYPVAFSEHGLTALEALQNLYYAMEADADEPEYECDLSDL